MRKLNLEANSDGIVPLLAGDVKNEATTRQSTDNTENMKPASWLNTFKEDLWSTQWTTSIELCDTIPSILNNVAH